MLMPYNITELQRTTWRDQWNHAIQQRVSKFRDCVVLGTAEGDSVERSFLDAFELEEKTQRFEKIVLEETKHNVRRLLPKEFKKYIGFDLNDRKYMGGLDLPVSETIEALQWAAQRKMDETILGVNLINGVWTKGLGGILGTNKGGLNGQTDFELSENLIVPVNYVSKGNKTNSRMTIAKLQEAITLWRELEIVDDNMGNDRICCAITPRDAQSLAEDDRLQNTNYGFQVLKNPLAEIPTIMGINFMVTNKLPLDTDGNYICPMWLKNSVELDTWDNTRVLVKERDDMDEVTQVGCKAAFGAARLRDEAVIQIKSFKGTL